MSTADAARPTRPRPVDAVASGWAGTRRLTGLLPLLGYAALAVLVFLPALRSPGMRIIGEHGDAEQTMWFLRWMPWAVSHGANPLLTDHLDHPTGVNLMWNSLAPLLGLALWPVSATAGLVVAYNVLVTGGIVLSGWCAYLAIRRFVARRLAAACGGLIYGFSPFLLIHAHGHAKVSFGVLPPLLLIALHEILVVQRHRPWVDGLGLGALIAAQLLVYEEGVVLAVIAAGVGVAVLSVTARSHLARARRHAARALLWSAVTAAVVVVAPLFVQLLGPHRIERTVPGASIYVTDAANLVLPTGLQLVAPSSAVRVTGHLSGNLLENGSYLGLPLLAVLGLAAVRWRSRPLVRWTVATAAVLLLLSLGPQLHVAGHDVGPRMLPWRLIGRIPLAGSALPSRLFIYVDLLAALLLALVAEALLRAPRRRGAAALAGLMVVIGVSLAPRVPFQSTPVEVPPFFVEAGVASLREGSVALVAPYAHDGPSDAAMLWQAAADMRFRMPEGYFTGLRSDGTREDGPRGSLTAAAMRAVQEGRRPPQVTPALRRRLVAELRRWGVSAVIVGPMAHRESMRHLVTAVLGRPPRELGGVLVWSAAVG